jgi:hypothetical protein
MTEEEMTEYKMTVKMKMFKDQNDSRQNVRFKRTAINVSEDQNV